MRKSKAYAAVAVNRVFLEQLTQGRQGQEVVEVARDGLNRALLAVGEGEGQPVAIPAGQAVDGVEVDAHERLEARKRSSLESPETPVGVDLGRRLQVARHGRGRRAQDQAAPGPGTESEHDVLVGQTMKSISPNTFVPQVMRKWKPLSHFWHTAMKRSVEARHLRESWKARCHCVDALNGTWQVKRNKRDEFMEFPQERCIYSFCR